MQVHIEDVSPVEKKLDVEIPWDKVRTKLDSAYRELGKEVAIPGFRKGKVPRSVLERMFGRKVQVEVARELVQESFLQAAQEHKIDPVAEPVVEDASIKTGESFKYTARIEVRGPVELKTFEGIAATRRPVKIEDDAVQHALENKRLEHVEFRPIEGRTAAEASDVLLLSVKGKVGEIPIDRDTVSVDLSEPMSEPLPGMIQALLGLALDAKDHPLKLEIPEDSPQKEIAGKTADLTIAVKEARQKVMPSLDDEFAKDTGEADTLDELKLKIREKLEARTREEAEREARQNVLKELVKANPLQIAPALVERAMDIQMNRARYSLAMQGIDLERAGVDLSGMRDRLRDSAREEVAGQLLLEAVAEKENVDVSDDEVAARVAELAKAQQKPAQKLRAEMERDGSLDSLRFRLRQEKALDLVVSRATITEAEPPPDEPPAAEGEQAP